ncbi:MAG: polyketide synthase dehydratase domain-containing protein [Pirellulaceae bacterium]
MLSDDRSAAQTEGQIPAPLLTAPTAQGECTWSATVRPCKDPFLTEHMLDGRPLLPFVIAAEMLLEAGQRSLGTNSVLLRDVTALSALRFFGDAQQDLRIETRATPGAGSSRAVECRLLSDFVARDGRLVEANRVNFSAQVVAVDGQGIPTAERRATLSGNGQQYESRIKLPPGEKFQPVNYPDVGAKFYVGWLQRLKRVALVGWYRRTDFGPSHDRIGRVRDAMCVGGIPSARLDACLFAVGILA